MEATLIFFGSGPSHIHSGGFTVVRVAVELGVLVLKFAIITTQAYEIRR